MPTFPNENDETIVNMIVEIPKGTNRKMEMSVSELYNPILQDEKKARLRLVPAPTQEGIEELFYNAPINNEIIERNDQSKINAHNQHIAQCKKFNIKTYKDIYGKPFSGYNLFSYGAIPQTFEDKKSTNKIEFIDGNGQQAYEDYYNEEIGSMLPLRGDGDPLDICLLNDNIKRNIGDIVQAKVIGIFPMIDDGEIDWKIIAVPKDKSNPNERDIFKAKCWFKYYKDKSPSKTGIVNISDALLLGTDSKRTALNVVQHCHEEYKNIVNSCPDSNKYKEFVEIDEKIRDAEHKPISANLELYKTVIFKNAFSDNTDCRVFADHSYHIFDVKISGKSKYKIITANGGSILHPKKGINKNIALFKQDVKNIIFNKENNIILLRIILELVKNSLRIKTHQEEIDEEYKKNPDSIELTNLQKLDSKAIKNKENIKKDNLKDYKESIDRIIKDKDPIINFTEDIKNIAKNLTPNADATAEFTFDDKADLKKHITDLKKLGEKFSNIVPIEDQKIIDILKDNLMKKEKQYAVLRELAGLFQAQTTGGFKLSPQNPYNTKNKYLELLFNLANKCDILILTEGIPKDEVIEPSTQGQYKILYKEHFKKNKKGKEELEETTNVIFKNQDLDIKFLDDSIPGKDMTNSSLIKIKNEYILNIHGPSDGKLTPTRLYEDTYKELINKYDIKYICGDSNMEDYYQDKLRPRMRSDFVRYFGEHINLQIADFKIKKTRHFGMPYINNQFWKGSDPVAYDAQFALTISDLDNNIKVQDSIQLNTTIVGGNIKTKKRKFNKISIKKNRYRNLNKNKYFLKNKIYKKNKKHKTKKRRKRVL